MRIRPLCILLVVLLVPLTLPLLLRDSEPESGSIPALPLLPHDGPSAARRLLSLTGADLIRLTEEIYVAEPEDPEFREAIIPALIELVARGGRPGQFAHSALGRFRPESTRFIPQIVTRAEASDPDARLRLVWLLGEIKSSDAVPHLHRCIRLHTSDLASAAVCSVVQCDRALMAPGALEAFVDGLKHRSAAVRCQAARSVCTLDRLPTEVVAAHRDLLDTRNPRIAEAARYSLFRLGRFKAGAAPYVEVLLDFVHQPRTWEKTSRFQCQVAALNVLVEVAPDQPEVRSAFVECLESKGIYVRRSAMDGLGAVSGLTDEERTALQAALSDPVRRNREAARRALSNH